MHKSKSISVLGCGWLGFPLGKELVKAGFFVRGGTTTIDKLSELSKWGIDPFLVQFKPEFESTRGEEFFNAEMLYINIPPKGDCKKFLDQMDNVLQLVLKNGIKKVIFISSTSVYGDLNAEVDEKTDPIPGSAIGEALLVAEKMFLNSSSFKTTVIRFGGLVGSDRHPGRLFARKIGISNGRAPVNLIHRKDCIGIILEVLSKEMWGLILNACSPDHLSRQEYYKLESKALHLPAPNFKDELTKWKKVNSLYLTNLLQYQFKVEDWKKWLLEFNSR
jgi:nucleoside-diphosphate-sugar epimerase